MASQVSEKRGRKRRTIKKYLFGGDATPMAGDGYGLVSKPCPVEFREISYQTPVPSSVNVPLIEKSPPPEVFEFVNTQTVHHSSINSTPRQPSPGYQAPRCSVTTDMSTSSPRILPPSPTSIRTSLPSTPKPARIEQIPWEDYEIPDELGIVKEGTPQEIRNIILESLNERRAMRTSRLHQEAMVIQSRFETATTRRGTGDQDIAESSANASAHSSPASKYHRTGSALSQSSNTTLGSENEDELFQPPIHSPSEGLRFQHSRGSLERQHSPPPSPKSATLSPQMAQVEFQVQQNRVRTTKSRKPFKLLPTIRKSKTRPNTPETANQNQSPTTYECTSCFDDITAEAAVDGLPCNHKYCPPCFTKLILTFIHCEATFPPKCCLLEIPPKVIRTHLFPTDSATYDQKALEYAIPIANRYYCPHPPCARWIDARHAKSANGGLTCPHCQNNICLVCRGPAHPSNQDCPQDYGLSSTLEQAEWAGWQRCFKCRTLVERNQGCRHITCKCGGEFCYTCGKRWRTCSCTEADQARLDEQRAIRASQRETDARHEEEEVRAAIIAVEKAERQLAEERAVEERRAAEEAAELARREEERVAKVARHFEHLRKVLEMVKSAQRSTVEARHKASAEMIAELEQHRERVVAAREREILAERKRLLVDRKRTIEDLQTKHARAMMETIARHRAHQDELLDMDVSHRVSRNPYQVARQSDALKAAILEALLPTQELERAELKAQQGREIRKWRGRMERKVREHETERLLFEARNEEMEKVRRMVEEGKRREVCDWKWFESVFEERGRMLGEDEGRFVSNGTDAPATPLSEPERKATNVSDGSKEGEKLPQVEVARTDSCTNTSDGDLSDYVRMRGWSGTPNFGLGMGMGVGRQVAVGG